MRDSNENNLMLQEKMLGIQKQSLDLDAKKIANQTKLAKMGIGTSKEVKQAKNLYKLEQQQEKQKKAGIDAEIAATNKLLETSKLQQQIDNFAEDNALELGDLAVDRASIQLLIQKRDEFAAGKTKTDLTDIEKSIVTNLENQIRAVTNSEIAVDNMDAQVVLQGQLTTNAEATKTWADKLLDIQERQLEVAFKKLGLQRTLNELKRKEADITLFGYAKARQAFAGKGDAITARKAQNTTDINAAIFGLKQAGIDPNAEGFDPTVPMTAATKQTTGAAAGTGLVQVDKANEFLKQFNTQTEAGVNLTAEWNNYIAERGVFATNLLATENELLASQREQVLTLNPAQEIYNEKYLAHVKEFGTEVEFNAEGVAALAVEQASVNIELELMTGIQDTLKNGFMSMFQSLIDGSKSFKDSMKDLAKSVLADLAAMYLKAAALKFMLAFMPGGDAVMATLKGTRYGGIQTGYAGGGVAAGPNSGYLAKLHGTEAVVPLGNDRAIPVDLKGAGGNVVNVAVNISGQGASTQSTGAGDAAALGRSIGGLVQQHLQTEMRPGGLLNRQGATGRGG
jgi:hypothetical protein